MPPNLPRVFISYARQDGEAFATALRSENFDEVVASVAPRVACMVPDRISGEGGQLAVDLTFSRMEDFDPEAIAARVPPLARLLAERASDPTRWKFRREAAVRRAAAFSWSRYATAITAIYGRVAGVRGSESPAVAPGPTS